MVYRSHHLFLQASMQIHISVLCRVMGTLVFLFSPFALTEMPVITEQENPSQLWKKFQPRVKNDIMVPYGLDFHKEVHYFVDWEKKYSLDELLGPHQVGQPDIDAKTLLFSNMNCKALFGNGRVYYRAFGTSGVWEGEIAIDPSLHHYLDMKPFPAPSQAVISRIRTCCDPAKCPEQCFQTSQVSSAPFIITTPDKASIIAGGYCTYCAIKPCISQCSEGEFATNNAIIDEESDLQLSTVACSPCLPGTWNTCKRGDSCKWNIPEAGTYHVGDRIPEIRPPPVGKCFDCKLAINWRKHYELTGREYVLNDDVDSWYCAGGGYPPRACPSGDYTNTWDWSDCACKNGTYTDPQNSKSCIPCPRGRYCTMNVSRPCPMHYFQDDEGATACKPCASSADELGITNVCDLFNKQLRVCDPAHPETQSRPLVSNCMECSKCKVRYQAEIAGQVDCYRSTQIK